MRLYFHMHFAETEGLKGVVTRVEGEDESRTAAKILAIGQLDDGPHNASTTGVGTPRRSGNMEVSR